MIHLNTSRNAKIRNVHQSKGIQYTVNLIPKYLMINVGPSPSIPRTPEPIPMHHHAPPLPLVELSLADAIALIEKAQDFPTQTQSQWVCSLRQIAQGLDRPLELIPARWTGFACRSRVFITYRLASRPRLSLITRRTSGRRYGGSAAKQAFRHAGFLSPPAGRSSWMRSPIRDCEHASMVWRAMRLRRALIPRRSMTRSFGLTSTTGPKRQL
jgi:hypothetical protein